MKTLIRTLAVAATAGLILPALASAADYPAPANPGTPSPRPGGSATLKVCAKGGQYKTIQAAVKAARSGDTIKICDGTYKEAATTTQAVQIEGAVKNRIKLVGNVKDPSKVVIDAAGKLNGIIINSANDVTLQGMTAKNYFGNGFFAVNVNGYVMDHLRAFGGAKTGDNSYGLYAFNSIGVTMTNDEAYYNTDAGFYIGQTPVQVKPKTTIVKNVSSWGNILGWSGTNMRYVTITKSFFFNNATGLVPNALVSELFPPEEDNVITDNDIYWNNYNYLKGSAFPKVTPGTGGIPYPIGVGILLFGGRRQTISKNRIFGNWGAGVGMIEQVTMGPGASYDKSQPVGEKAWKLRDNRVTGNFMGNGGKDLNGRDLAYDGSGSGNCFSDNALSPGVESLPAFSLEAFPICNPAGEAGPSNKYNEAAQLEAITWATDIITTKAPGGTIARPFSASYKGMVQFPKAGDGAWTIWNSKVKAPKTPW
ncbi:MAG: right-handed parallel beta-helix repeat-containing protein [Solirubrobacterales bacterium]|nr:right-handed parallel beta-helix repeat-containing protein [Solirubrobacterales bacterium]